MKAFLNSAIKAYSKPYKPIFSIFNLPSIKTFTAFSSNTKSSSNANEFNISKVKSASYPTIPKLFFVSLFHFRSMFTKRNTYLNKNKNYQMRDRKALRRRVIVVGPSFFRHFLHKRTHFHHKKNKKTRANRNKPKYKLLSMAMVKFARRNLPSYKKKSFKLGKRNV